MKILNLSSLTLSQILRPLLLLVGVWVLFALPVMVRADISVNGYVNRRGHYVQPYHRTAPDQFKQNNYGYRQETPKVYHETLSNNFNNLDNTSFKTESPVFSDSSGDEEPHD